MSTLGHKQHYASSWTVSINKVLFNCLIQLLLRNCSLFCDAPDAAYLASNKHEHKTLREGQKSQQLELTIIFPLKRSKFFQLFNCLADRKFLSWKFFSSRFETIVNEIHATRITDFSSGPVKHDQVREPSSIKRLHMELFSSRR